MDRLDEMSVFTRIVEMRSFSKAAADLGQPRSTVTDAVKRLERRLGTSLLHRTTRVVRPTDDGIAFYDRCKSILADVEDAENTVAGRDPKGGLRINVHGTVFRHFLMPYLPDFRRTYPDIMLHISETDRLVDLVREGADCVLRVGHPTDSDMKLRKLADLDEITCASPDYLARFGTPSTFRDLKDHQMIGFRSSSQGGILDLEFVENGQSHNVSLPCPITVDSANMLTHCARAGFGLIQKPRYSAQSDLDSGRLVEILAQTPPSPSPVSLLYPPGRYVPPRLRVFMDWVIDVFAT